MGSDNTNQLRASATPTLWKRNGRPPYSQRIYGPRGQEEASNAGVVVEIGAKLASPLGADNSGPRLRDQLCLRRPPHAANPAPPINLNSRASPACALSTAPIFCDYEVGTQKSTGFRLLSSLSPATYSTAVHVPFGFSAPRPFAAPPVGSPLAVATKTEPERHSRGPAAQV
jgi:hypothetical protein